MIFFSPFERRFHLFVNLQPVLDEPKNAHACKIPSVRPRRDRPLGFCILGNEMLHWPPPRHYGEERRREPRPRWLVRQKLRWLSLSSLRSPR